MTTEDRKNEAQEKSALAEAMGAAKRKSKDMAKKMMKKVALAFAKAAIPMFLALLKVLAVVIVVAIITSLIGSVLDWFSGGESNTNTDETYNSVVSTEASGMDITSETIRLSEDEIKSYIENYDSTNITLKNEMLGKIEEIYKWQEDYGYSAMFLITIAFEDNINAEAIDDFITEMSTKAATWNINGYKATKEIAKEYVADDTYADWANNIENKIQENAVKSGIIILGQEVALSGDGYDNAYISKKGTMYRNYKQTKGSYSQVKWCGEDTIYESACPLICVTILASGYTNSERNPLEIVNGCTTVGVGLDIAKALAKCGLSYTIPYDNNEPELSQVQKNNIINYVKAGKPAMIRVIKPSMFTNSQHWMVLLDYNSTTNEFYLSNPNHYGASGWINAETVLKGCTRYIGITNL